METIKSLFGINEITPILVDNNGDIFFKIKELTSEKYVNNPSGNSQIWDANEVRNLLTEAQIREFRSGINYFAVPAKSLGFRIG